MSLEGGAILERLLEIILFVDRKSCSFLLLLCYVFVFALMWNVMEELRIGGVVSSRGG